MADQERVFVSHHHNPEEDAFTARLVGLGYEITILNGAEVILPPLCDVPAGPFLMGSDPTHDEQAYGEEKPQHWVTLLTFRIARFPVTVAEYARFVRASGHAEPTSITNEPTWRQQRKRLDHPVVNVTWHDAMAYASWLASVTGAPWRLPSEAEWEKAARWGDTARIFPWGDDFDVGRCNTDEGGKGTTTPVGVYPSGASPCGAEDMAGNVWEWTSSAFEPYPYNADDGRESADANELRVRRGGSWLSADTIARTACRGHFRPISAHSYCGFRLARSVPNA
jgi:formylglycine-generating enzyme required for sulfatase activity